MSTWNGKRFSVYTSDEKSALGIIKELGGQTNYNTDELEKVKISDSKKVSHQEMQDTYKIDKDANFTGSWFGIKKPTASQEGLQATVDKINKEDIPNINSQLDTKANQSELEVERNRIDLLTKIENGETQGNAELLDIRVNANGVTNNSAGETVREIARGEGIVKGAISLDKISKNEFISIYNKFDKLTSNSDNTGNWCNNIVYNKGFVVSVKIRINGETEQNGKLFLYEKLSNGNIIYRKEYDINGVGDVIIPINEVIEYDFMLSTKCSNVGYKNLGIDLKSSNLGTTTTEFTPNFNGNYTFAIGVYYNGLVKRLEKVEDITNILYTNKSKYAKLNYCALGDSITKGENSLDSYNPMIGQRYTDLAKDYFGFNKVTNLGLGGSRITRHTVGENTKYGMIDRLEQIPKDTDILCVFGGTNDFGGNVRIGDGNSDLTTFKYTIKNMISTIFRHFPKIKLYFITPIHRNDKMPDNIPNSAGHTLKDYVDTIKEVCEFYGVPVLDLYNIYGISPFIDSQKNMYMPDGLHPIPIGMERLAYLNNKFIESMF